MAVSPQRVAIQSAVGAACATHLIWGTLDLDTRATHVRRIERSCFSRAIAECERDGVDRLFTNKKFVDRYSAICSKIIANIDAGGLVGSDHLINGICDGSVDCYTVADLSSEALCPDASRAERAEIHLRQSQKMVLKVSRKYYCHKCGGNETLPLEYQSRAVDELSSKSVKCVSCGYVWRI